MNKPYSDSCNYIFANPQEENVHFVTGDIGNKGQVISIKTNCGEVFDSDFKMYVRKYQNQDSISTSSICIQCTFNKICDMNK